MDTLSIKLFKTLSKGKEQLGKEALGRVTDFVGSQHTCEDTFMDKSGKVDIYYTLYGWMLSYILGIGLNRRKTAVFLEEQESQNMDLIHYAAYKRCCMIYQLMFGGKINLLLKSILQKELKQLQDFRGLPNNDLQSPYTQFVWLSLLEDTRQKIKDKNEVLHSLVPYQVVSGGYSNIKNGTTASTNATVAALAVTGQLGGYKNNKDIEYLQNLQECSGGFGATMDSPMPDMLSTATALFMLRCYNIKPVYASGDFIEAHWLDSGGFSATLMEESSDVEYTFYGLLATGA